MVIGDQEIISVPFSIVRPGAHVHLADAEVSATVSTGPNSTVAIQFTPCWFISGAADAFEPIVSDADTVIKVV